MQGRADRWATWLPVVWSCLLALLLLGPALAPGYVLSYDMVWVPELDMRSDFLGLATSLPRVVPSDAVVAVLDSVVPGMVLQKVVLLGSLVAGGLGAVRLVPDLSLVGKLAVISLYQWSPLVAERLLIGHWPVLIAWACLPWVLHLTQRWQRDDVLPAALPVVLVLGSLSASAGVVTAVALFAGALGGPARRWAVAVGLAAAANAPWVVAGLLHAGSATTTTDGSAPFALQAEGAIPAPVAALSLGGIWNGDVVPVSRTGLAGWLTAAVVVILAALGLRAWRSVLGRPLGAGAGGLLGRRHGRRPADVGAAGRRGLVRLAHPWRRGGQGRRPHARAGSPGRGHAWSARGWQSSPRG